MYNLKADRMLNDNDYYLVIQVNCGRIYTYMFVIRYKYNTNMTALLRKLDETELF